MNKGLLTLFGFALFFTGMIAIVLSMIGINFVIFSFLSGTSGLFSFVFYLGLSVIGLLMVIIPNSNLSNDEEIVEP